MNEFKREGNFIIIFIVYEQDQMKSCRIYLQKIKSTSTLFSSGIHT